MSALRVRARVTRSFWLGLVLAAAACTVRLATDPGPGLSPTRLKYRLEQGRTLFYCDPDYYPVGRGDELARALEVFPTIAADTEKYDAILEHLGLPPQVQPSDSTKLRIYRESKRLATIVLTPAGADYTFQLREQDTKGAVFAVSGRVTSSGQILSETRTPSYGGCPICLSGETRIATPWGERAVQTLRVGDTVLTAGPFGLRVAAPLVRVGHVPAPGGHQFVQVVLADGRRLLASPGHPTAGGRPLGTLAPGDTLAGSRVVSAARVTTRDSATYDILPRGASGLYWANGIPLASTLSAPPRLARGGAAAARAARR